MSMELKRSQGFTLMEMMMALLISAIIVAPFYIISSGLADRSARQQLETEAMQRGRDGLNMLSTDLGRVGLLVSPNPFADPRSLCVNIPASTARHRRAIVHLNPSDNSMGMDEILITGNFLGYKSYPATVNDNTLIIAESELRNLPEDCEEQFHGDYAYAHVIAPSGLHFDASVVTATYNEATGTCDIELANTDLPVEGITSGDMIFVGANQTLLYRVEKIYQKVGETTDSSGHTEDVVVVHNELIKYFAKYGATDPGTCDGMFQIVPRTRQVVIKYIEDFQVWFRPIQTNFTVPNYYPVAALGNMYDFALDQIGTVPGQHHVLPNAPGNTPNVEDLSCQGSTIQPEHIRSAVIRIAVRSERTHQRLDWRDFDNDTDPSNGVSRLARMTMRPYSSESTLPDRPGAVYQIKTLITEVAMPNLTARSDILWGEN